LAIAHQIRRSEYHDSVVLMEVARELNHLPGVIDAAIMMATEANLALLRDAGLIGSGMEGATANDLIVAVQADSDSVAGEALAVAGARLTFRPQAGQSGVTVQPRTLRGAVRSNASANLAIISVAGQYAVAEAWEALWNGLHVLLFSDNVPIEDEIALKRYAVEHGLLMMGPDCGTAILNGVALGFANAVPRGPVGIVAAAGTGLQEVSTLLAKRGVGISQGIGTGGRDVKEAVGGLTMLQGLKALQADPGTDILLIVSKPPVPVVAERVLAQVKESSKPTVVCFIGSAPAPVAAACAVPARTLQEAAYLAAAQVSRGVVQEAIEQEMAKFKPQAAKLREGLGLDQRYLRGLYSGGTLAAEALVVWQNILDHVRSNIALDPELLLADATRSEGHCAVDLGEDEFTVGRPHPMIDNGLRIRRLMQEAADAEVAVIVLDVVLGYGAHPDPAGELGPAIQKARALARAEGRELVVIVSVTGTEGDPQCLSRQVEALERGGAIVAPCNAAAARLAGYIVAEEVQP
jgi:succinyl-CoA synthetase alpha subunit